MPLLRPFSITLFLLFFTSLITAQSCSDSITAYPLCSQVYLHFVIAEGIGKVVDAPHVPCQTGDNPGQCHLSAR